VGPGELADHLGWPRHPAVRHASRFIPPRAQRRHRRDRMEDLARRASVVGKSDCGRHFRWRAGRDQCVELHPGLRRADRARAVASGRIVEDHGTDADTRERSDHRRERTRARASDLRGQAWCAGRRDAAGRAHEQRCRGVELHRTRVVHADAARLQRAALRASEQRRARRLRREDRPRSVSSATAARRQRVQRLAGGCRRQNLSVE
jgi:hypothetical protein